MIEKAATDIYTFENLRKGQYTYVDKTAILKTLAGVAFDSDMRNLSDRKIEVAAE